MEIFFISIFVIIASCIGTMTGFGASTIMVPVFLMFMPLGEALLITGIIHWFVDIWKVVLFRNGLSVKLILAFGLPGIVASFLGASLVDIASQSMLSRFLGAFLMVYGLFLFFHPNFRLGNHRNALTAFSGGTLSGFFAGLFGVGGVVNSAFLSAFDLSKTVFIATAGAVSLFIDSTRLITYVANGERVAVELLWGLIIFIPLSYMGSRLAKVVVKMIPQKYFRSFIAIFLFLIGVKLLLFVVKGI